MVCHYIANAIAGAQRVPKINVKDKVFEVYLQSVSKLFKILLFVIVVFKLCMIFFSDIVVNKQNPEFKCLNFFSLLNKRRTDIM